MTFDFGRVVRYNSRRGFGFVSHYFRVSSKEVFFHIKQLRRFNQGWADSLDHENEAIAIYFWYEYRVSPRGHEVIALLHPTQVSAKYDNEIEEVISLMRRRWICIDGPLSRTLKEAASSLMSKEDIDQLVSNRKLRIEEQARQEAELRRVEKLRAKELAEKQAAELRQELARKREIREQRTAQQKAELERRNALKAQKQAEDKEREDEFRRLVAEIKPLNFTQSSQVSSYIVKKKLGFKYRNISGILQMERDGETWDFNGGFPSDIYARLCEALGLKHKGSRAHPGEFTPYKDILEL
jgi:hypothetical protein